MGVPMGVPIFAHFGAAHVRPHGTYGLVLPFGVHWGQLAQRHDCEPEFSRIFQKNNDSGHFGHFGPWGGSGTPLWRGRELWGTLLMSIWGFLSLLPTPHRVLSCGTPYFFVKGPKVIHLTAKVIEKKWGLNDCKGSFLVGVLSHWVTNEIVTMLYQWCRQVKHYCSGKKKLSPKYYSELDNKK